MTTLKQLQAQNAELCSQLVKANHNIFLMCSKLLNERRNKTDYFDDVVSILRDIKVRGFKPTRSCIDGKIYKDPIEFAIHVALYGAEKYRMDGEERL